jgi:hypothetical protein
MSVEEIIIKMIFKKLLKMEFFISETNREKKSLIYDGYT